VNRAVLDSHRVVALRQGAVVYSGPPADVMQPDVLRRIYDTEFLLVPHPGADLPMIVPGVPAEGPP